MHFSQRSLAVPIVVLALSLAACGSSGTSASKSTPAADGSTTSTSTTAATTTTGKVSANDASIDELTAAFDAAGIVPADRWAREVDEYRPYPTDDPDFAKLRQELAKYNPSPELVDQIVATLSLP